MDVPQLRFDGFDGEWKQYSLKDISIVKDGTHDSPKYYSEGFPLITSKNLMKNGELDLKNVSLINDTDFHEINKRSKVDDGDILFGMIGTIGNPVRVKSSNFAIKNVALIKEDKVTNEYILHYLKSPSIYKQFHINQAGGTQKFIGLGLIRDLTISVPKEKELQKVTSFFSILEKKYIKQQEKIEKLEQFKKGMMQKIFSQELRFKDEDGGEFGEWENFTLGDIAIIKGRLGWKGLKQEEYVKDGAYLVAGKHIKKGVIQWEKCDQITDFRYQESIEIALEENDIIFSKDGSLGNPALVKNLPKEATINSTMMLVRIINNIIPNYLYQILLGPDFKRLIHLKVSGSSIPHLFQADMKEFEFLAPSSIKEQNRISLLLENIDTKMEKEREKLTVLEEQKKGFLQRMFV